MNIVGVVNIVLSAIGILNLFFCLTVLFNSANKAKIRIAFGILAFSSAAWTFSMVFYRSASTYELLQVALKVLYIVPIALPLSFVYFASVYCKEAKKAYLHAGLRVLVLIYAILLAILVASTDLITTSAHFVEGKENVITFGGAYVLYVLYQIIVFLWGYWYLFVEHKNAVHVSYRRQTRYVLVGTFLGSSGGLVFNLVLPWFNFFALNWLGNVFTVFFAGFLFYATIRHGLFNLKVFAASGITIFIWMTLFVRILISYNFVDLLINVTLFLTMLVAGLILIQSVKKEIDNREKGERLARYLANANARLRELDKQKTEFVSIASHQLRSPIAAIKGYASLVVEGSYGKVPEHLKEPLGRILDSGQRIGVMVDDFLNVTRIEQGRMTYNMTPQNVHTLLRAVVEELQVVAKEKGLDLSVKGFGAEKAIVRADEGKLKQIFSNLIDNALKYTQKGSVTVFVEIVEEKKKVLVKIVDTGIGIAPEEVSNLFQKFNRASNANEVNVLGTGLGLYIAREIMKAHEGWIDVQSEGLGKGSTFTVELPMCTGGKDCDKEKAGGDK